MSVWEGSLPDFSGFSFKVSNRITKINEIARNCLTIVNQVPNMRGGAERLVPPHFFQKTQIQSGSAIFGSIITPRTTVLWTRATNRLLSNGRWSKKISRNSGDDFNSHVQAPKNVLIRAKSDTRRPERRRTFGKKKSGLGSPGGQSMPISQGGSILSSTRTLGSSVLLFMV